MNKKKRNKRKALVVEQDEDQDVVDLEDLWVYFIKKSFHDFIQY